MKKIISFIVVLGLMCAYLSGCSLNSGTQLTISADAISPDEYITIGSNSPDLKMIETNVNPRHQVVDHRNVNKFVTTAKHNSDYSATYTLTSTFKDNYTLTANPVINRTKEGYLIKYKLFNGNDGVGVETKSGGNVTLSLNQYKVTVKEIKHDNIVYTHTYSQDGEQRTMRIKIFTQRGSNVEFLKDGDTYRVSTTGDSNYLNIDIKDANGKSLCTENTKASNAKKYDITITSDGKIKVKPIF